MDEGQGICWCGIGGGAVSFGSGEACSAPGGTDGYPGSLRDAGVIRRTRKASAPEIQCSFGKRRLWWQG